LNVEGGEFNQPIVYLPLNVQAQRIHVTAAEEADPITDETLEKVAVVSAREEAPCCFFPTVSNLTCR
jgi:hypothetical protein